MNKSIKVIVIEKKEHKVHDKKKIDGNELCFVFFFFFIMELCFVRKQSKRLKKKIWGICIM